MISKNLEKLIKYISDGMDIGVYNDYSERADDRILHDIETHECFKSVTTDPLCSSDILELVRFYREASNW